jgi:hypothetical protein
MAQKTNLNISPYYDDFDSEKNFYKVLFNPGRPIQARELTTLQSILQNQIESFGSHIFKEGSMVIPGNIAYDGQFYAVKLNPTNFGIDISLYIDKFVGKKIIGQISGTTALVQYVTLPDNINVDDLTIYVKYLDSDNNFVFNQFEDGESLIAEENIIYGNTTINAGIPFASSISLNATSIGSAASIGDGVYFIRGYFVNVSKQTIILDNYTNTPSYRVGLKIDELLISAKDDKSLFDNAKGFTNYAAPGADRLQINLTLTKKLITDLNDTDFIELLRVQDGKIKKIESKTNYNIIRDYLADRTYDESGDYAVTPFSVSVHNSLNNRLGSNGLFFDNETTDENNKPSDTLMGIKVSPGKAYVKGYDVDKISTTIIDVEKPRDTETVSTINIPFEMGNILRVNTVSGAPKQREKVELYNRLNGGGDLVGYARVYNLRLTDAAYSGNSSKWDLCLYDIQSYTKLVLNKNISTTELPKSSFVKGKSSGASGYAVADGGASATIQLSQTSGKFSQGEQLIINGVDSSTSIKSITTYGTQNIKSVKQTTAVSGLSVDFNANAFLERFNFQNNVSKVTITSGGTVTSAGNVFSGVRENTIIRYQKQGSSVETFNRITSVSPDGLSITVVAITSVSGVFDGTLPSGTIEPNIQIGAPIIVNESTGYLYAQLPDSNISSVNLSDSLLTISTQISGKTISGGQLSLTSSDISGISSAFFAAFDEERYSVHYSGGGIGTVTQDSFRLNSNVVTIRGLIDGSNATVNATLIKNGIQSKKKEYNRSKILNIEFSKYSQSGISSSSSINDGLTYNQFYGLRVQDEQISLNYPDVCKVLAVYESYDSLSPSLDTVRFTSSADVSTNAIIGENIIGNSSKAIARIVSKPSTNVLGIVYLNTERFFDGETVKFEESNIIVDIELITVGNYKDITYSYQLDKGQRDQYYDYSRLVRNKNAPEPSKKLLIVFDYYSVPSNDTGDVFTVLSYDQERFSNDIPTIGPRSIRASDTLDFRPRVAVFTVTNKSPFDFDSRSFNSDPKVILSSNESSLIGYDYYLPRVDKLYLDKFGTFILEKGISSKKPRVPSKTGDVMDIATITLPPYLYNPSDATVTQIDNRRYTMRDIGIIQERVSNLERVTSLSLLEVNTQTLQIQDSDGRNRFKTGFFVDDFKDYTSINRRLSSIQINNQSNELIPIISRNSLKSQLAPAIAINDNQLDLSVNYDLLDPNVQKTGNAVTLKYKSVDWIEQSFATRVENVNPFNVIVYIGDIKLDPDRDYWIRTIQLPDRHVSNTIAMPSINLTNNVSNNVSTTSTSSTNTTVERVIYGMGNWQDATTSDPTYSLSSTSSSSTSSSTAKNGTIADYDTTIQNIKVSSAEEKFIRSRNIEFSTTNLKPSTQFYLFFDSNSAVDFVPKLVEISNDSTLANYGSSGSFVVGEEVVGTSNGQNLITFRVANANHKYGAFNSPSSTYMINPYIKGESLPLSYSSSSKVLNIDTYSLSQEAQGKYSGYLVKGMRLVGQTSGAVAYVKDLRLITDNYGDLIGTSFLKDPNTIPPPSVRIETGTKTFKLTSSSTNALGLPGSNAISYAESNYSADGMFEQWENLVTTTIRNTDINTTTNTTTNTTNTDLNSATTTTVTRYVDPLAQSFVVGGNVEAPSPTNTNDDVNGAFLTAVDLYFGAKDGGNAPVKVEIRTVELGTPTRFRIGNAVTLRPDQVNISDDAETPTKVTFDEPIYLAPGREYAVVIISETSDQYELWCATMGEKTVNTKSLPDADSVKYSKQFSMGSLFKSQNGSIWTANQYQDLKFKLYKAEFTSPTGTAFFYNPTLDKSNGYVEKLISNPLKTLPKTATLGITTTTNAPLITTLSNGRKIVGSQPYVYGYVVGTGSSVSTVGLTTGGKNYVTDSSVDTFNIIGNGSGLKLNISVTDGVITGTPTVVIGNSGNGYAIGDIVGIVTSTVSSNTGTGAYITISAIGNSLDTLYLSGVQGGTFNVGAGLSYYNDAGTIVSLASTTIRNFTPTGGVNSGNYIKVDHFDHGMYSNTNKLVISGAESDVPATILSTQLLSTDVSIVSIADTSNFGTFEGVKVSGTNLGYIKIENEIISYSDVGNGTLTGIIRAIDLTKALNYEINSLVNKYEINGVSLRRINASHDISDSKIGIDDYYIEINRATNAPIDRSVDASGLPELSFKGESNIGGSNVYATSNITYNSLVPSYDVITPANTSATATIRTTTGTSVGGNETSFLDNGFEPVQLNTLNVLESVRLVCSKENETQYLSNLPRNKSFTTGITLNSSNKYLSPVIYLSNSSTEFRNNRLDNPISDYVADSRVNSITNDPHAASYVSRLVSLTQPASSLKVILSAYRHSSSDFRVLYSLIRADSSEVPQAFELFPGYNNLQYSNTNQYSIIDPAKNEGLPDLFVRPSLDNEFLEYQFTADNLDLFTGYAIKIVISGTNQAYPVRIKELRAIAIR